MNIPGLAPIQRNYNDMPVEFTTEQLNILVSLRGKTTLPTDEISKSREQIEKALTIPTDGRGLVRTKSNCEEFKGEITGYLGTLHQFMAKYKVMVNHPVNNALWNINFRNVAFMPAEKGRRRVPAHILEDGSDGSIELVDVAQIASFMKKYEFEKKKCTFEDMEAFASFMYWLGYAYEKYEPLRQKALKISEVCRPAEERGANRFLRTLENPNAKGVHKAVSGGRRSTDLEQEGSYHAKLPEFSPNPLSDDYGSKTATLHTPFFRAIQCLYKTICGRASQTTNTRSTTQLRQIWANVNTDEEPFALTDDCAYIQLKVAALLKSTNFRQTFEKFRDESIQELVKKFQPSPSSEMLMQCSLDDLALMDAILKSLRV